MKKKVEIDELRTQVQHSWLQNEAFLLKRRLENCNLFKNRTFPRILTLTMWKSIKSWAKNILHILCVVYCSPANCKSLQKYPFFKIQLCGQLYYQTWWSSGISLDFRSFCQKECRFESHQYLRFFLLFLPFKNCNFTEICHYNCSLKDLKPNIFSEPVMWILTIVYWWIITIDNLSFNLHHWLFFLKVSEL